MVNREDNLKKINAELEKLSDEDLEKIAGGILVENADEKNLLKNDLPVKHNGIIPDW